MLTRTNQQSRKLHPVSFQSPPLFLTNKRKNTLTSLHSLNKTTLPNESTYLPNFKQLKYKDILLRGFGNL